MKCKDCLVTETKECEVCGHMGLDVEWQNNPAKSGYFCKDSIACFNRYKELRERSSF